MLLDFFSYFYPRNLRLKFKVQIYLLPPNPKTERLSKLNCLSEKFDAKCLRRDSEK